LELNGTHQPLVYVDDINLFGDNMNPIKENRKTFLGGSRDGGPKANAEKTKHIIASRHQDSGQNQTMGQLMNRLKM
jgi:hypothetical protein